MGQSTRRYMKLNPEAKAAWLTALRSGEYKQGQNRLHMVEPISISGLDRYCCIGVLCEVAIQHGASVLRHMIPANIFDPTTYVYDDSSTFAPHSVLSWANLDDWAQTELVKMNDNAIDDFETIADWIEENL